MPPLPGQHLMRAIQLTDEMFNERVGVDKRMSLIIARAPMVVWSFFDISAPHSWHSRCKFRHVSVHRV